VEPGGTGKRLNARAAAATARARFVPATVGLPIAVETRAVDSDCGLPLTTAEVPAVAVAPPEWFELHALIAMTPRSVHTDISLLTPVRRVIDAAGSTLYIVPSWERRVTGLACRRAHNRACRKSSLIGTSDVPAPPRKYRSTFICSLASHQLARLRAISEPSTHAKLASSVHCHRSSTVQFDLPGSLALRGR
jgi:hypothetical protein